jgi:hypothetical protein
MKIENLIKDERIISTIKHLAEKFGKSNFMILDFWEGDLCAIGLTDNKQKHLIYISVYANDGFDVSLENLYPDDLYKVDLVGDYQNLNMEALENIFQQHLQINHLKNV